MAIILIYRGGELPWGLSGGLLSRWCHFRQKRRELLGDRTLRTLLTNYRHMHAQTRAPVGASQQHPGATRSAFAAGIGGAPSPLCSTQPKRDVGGVLAEPGPAAEGASR